MYNITCITDIIAAVDNGDNGYIYTTSGFITVDLNNGDTIADVIADTCGIDDVTAVYNTVDISFTSNA
jgi:hypothetical protein